MWHFFESFMRKPINLNVHLDVHLTSEMTDAQVSCNVENNVVVFFEKKQKHTHTHTKESLNEEVFKEFPFQKSHLLNSKEIEERVFASIKREIPSAKPWFFVTTLSFYVTGSSQCLITLAQQ